MLIHWQHKMIMRQTINEKPRFTLNVTGFYEFNILIQFFVLLILGNALLSQVQNFKIFVFIIKITFP